MSVSVDEILPRLEGEEGWTRLEAPSWMGDRRQFIAGDHDPERLMLHYFRRESDQALMARVWLGPAAEGPPGHVHGGCLAAVLDECMGLSAWITNRPCLAGRITVEFRKPAPHGCVYTVEAVVASEEGRKLFTQARITHATQGDVAVSEGTFIRMSMERLAKLAPGRVDWPLTPDSEA